MKQRQRNKIDYQQGYTRMLNKDSDDDEETELFIRKASYNEIPTVEKTLEEGDTLQALSIRYHCSIAELKRLNNIHRENEIYAKRTIKVPARPFALALASVHVSGSSSPEENNVSLKKGVDAETLNFKLNHNVQSTPSTSKSSVEVNEVIFNSSVKPKPCDNGSENVHDINDEAISLLPKQAITVEPVVTRLSCSGADADIPWTALIVCIVIVIFAVPLIYVFYVAEHFEEYHHISS